MGGWVGGWVGHVRALVWLVGRSRPGGWFAKWLVPGHVAPTIRPCTHSQITLCPQNPSFPFPFPPSYPAVQDCLAGLMLGERRAEAMDEEKRAAATVRAVMRKLLTGTAPAAAPCGGVGCVA